MSTPTRRRLRAAVALAGTAALLSLGTLASAAPMPQAVTTTATSSSTVLTPTVVPMSASELANPLRGEYRWMGQASQPSGWPAPDLYYRDRTYWGRLEATKGTFDFSAIDAGLADAGRTGGKFGFRVMAYCPGCWMESRSDWPSVVPSWMPKDSSGVPRWNSSTFLSEWEKLWSTLGARYGKDPRLGYVDVGGFGSYGEWMPAGDSLSDASALRIIGAVAKAFPTKHVLLSAVTVYKNATVLQKALDTYPNLGMRSDCLGNPYMQKPEGSFSSVWKTRPFFTEWCINGDPVTGLNQVRNYHVSTISSGNLALTYSAMNSTQRTAYQTALKSAGYRYAVTRASFSTVSPGQPFTLDLTLSNAGTAPTYDPWTTRLVLKDSSGARAAVLPLSVDLRGVLPGELTFWRTLTAPALPTGTYTAAVEVLDPSGYSAPMRLANASRAADGSYPLGSLQVVAAGSGGGSATGTVTRLGGADRYDVSAGVSAMTFAPGVPVAYIATGEKFPDALSGGPAGGTDGGPVLLVHQNSIPDSVAAELTRLKPQRIVILGGSVSVSDGVKAALGAYVSG